MTSLRGFFARPLGQSILILSTAFLLYLIFGRPIEKINDFQINSNLAYLASGPEGIRILDISDPINLKEIGHFRCSSPILNPFDPNFRIINCARSARSIAIQENNLVLADGNDGLWLFDLSIDPLRPVKIDQLKLPGSANSVVVVGEYAYVASGRGGVQVVQINKNGNDNKPSLDVISNAAIKGNAVKIFYDGQYLYWLDNRNNLHFLNIKKPDKPEDIGQQSYKKQVFDMTFRGNYAFIAAGDQGLMIMNKSKLPDLTSVSQLSLGGRVQGVYLSGDYAYTTVKGVGIVIVDITAIKQPQIVQDTYSLAGSPTKIVLQNNVAYVANGADGLYSFASTVVINTGVQGQSVAQMVARQVAKAGKYLYVAADERGLRILDVSNPSRPQEVAFLDTPGRSDSVAIGGDVAYVADRTNGLLLVDVSNRSGELPVLLKIPSKDARDVVLDPGLSYAYLADSTEGFKIIDIKTPKSAAVISTLAPVKDQPVNPIAVTVFDNYAYLASADEGVYIINIADKNFPTQVGHLIIPGQADSRNTTVVAYNSKIAQTAGQDPYHPPMNDPNSRIFIWVANGKYGLQIFDVTNPTTPVQVPVSDPIKAIPGIAMDVYINGNRGYVAYDGVGVYILDTTNPASPQVIGFVTNPQAGNRAAGLTAEGSTVYLAMLERGVSLIDTTNPASPVVISQFDAPSSISAMAIQGDYAYTVDKSRGLWIFDIHDTKHPVEVSFVPIPEASGVYTAGDYVFVAAGSSGLKVVNVVNKSAPLLVGSIDTPGYANDVIVAIRPNSNPPSYLAYVADGQGGLFVTNVSNPAAPTMVGSISGIGNAIKLTYNQIDYVFISAEIDGLVAVNVVNPAAPVRMDSILTPPITLNSDLIVDRLAYVATGTSEIPILDVSYPLDIKVASDKVLEGKHEIVDVAHPLAINSVITTSSVISTTKTVSTTLSVSEPGTIIPNYAFLADKGTGVQILETTDPLDPQLRGTWNAAKENPDVQPQIIQVIPQWLPPQDNNPGTFQIYVADAVNGMTILSGTKATAIKPLDVYATDGMATLTALRIYVGGKNHSDPRLYRKAALTVRQLALDILLFGLVGAFCWIGFLAIFVIPIRYYSDWENIFSRLLIYLYNHHGPVIRVKEGKVIQYPGEEARPGPGLLLVDSTSAVVLEKRNAVGPGVGALPLARVVSGGYFMTGNRVYLASLRFNEVVRGVADLRPQVRLATNVNGYTRDGIEVETVIFAITTLGEYPDILTVAYAKPTMDEADNQIDASYPSASDLRVIRISKNHRGNWLVGSLSDELDEDDKLEIQQFINSVPGLVSLSDIETRKQDQSVSNGSPFVVDPVRIFQAIFAKSMDKPENKELDWTDLPTPVAIEIFRNILSREIYDKLYEPLLANRPPILDVKNYMRLRMRNQGVLSYHFIRRIDNQPLIEGQEIPVNEILSTRLQSLSNANEIKLLRSRGIKVKYAGFSELRPVDPIVRERFVDNWQAKWDRETDIVLGNYEMQAMRRRTRWRLSAQRAFIAELKDLLDQNPEIDKMALAMQVLQSLEALAADPDTRQLLPKETVDMLAKLRNWLLQA